MTAAPPGAPQAVTICPQALWLVHSSPCLEHCLPCGQQAAQRVGLQTLPVCAGAECRVRLACSACLLKMLRWLSCIVPEVQGTRRQAHIIAVCHLFPAVPCWQKCAREHLQGQPRGTSSWSLASLATGSPSHVTGPGGAAPRHPEPGCRFV